ncbi:MAG: FUSC family protein [Microbacterium sp.]|uniref:FUSC family protein n=1 Tax=Microbacterium sp. TaxID=51671 RepID=UPI003F9D6861
MNPNRRQRRGLRFLVESGKESPSAARLVLAVKTAVAAAVAWYLAPYVPFADNDYSYYAPLGVLVSMYPTMAGSARAGAQALIGLALGIALGIGGLGLVLLGAPGVTVVAAVICIGILIGGIRVLGAGAEWVAIAGLFVLLIGGPAAEEFSVSYLFTMAFGVMVGVLMNFVVFPPLYLQRASSRLSALRDATASSLSDIARSMTQEPARTEDIREATEGLAALLTAVEGDVVEAEESRKGNPRGRRRREGQDLISLRMKAIQHTTHAVIDLADTLLKAVDDGSLPDIATRRALADATRVCGELVAAPVDDSAADEKIERAARALDGAIARLNQHADPVETPDYSTAYAYAALICVRRIVDACREFASARANA